MYSNRVMITGFVGRDAENPHYPQRQQLHDSFRRHKAQLEEPRDRHLRIADHLAQMRCVRASGRVCGYLVEGHSRANRR